MLEAVVHGMDEVPGFTVLERGRITQVGGLAWSCGEGSEVRCGMFCSTHMLQHVLSELRWRLQPLLIAG